MDSHRDSERQITNYHWKLFRNNLQKQILKKEKMYSIEHKDNKDSF